MPRSVPNNYRFIRCSISILFLNWFFSSNFVEEMEDGTIMEHVLPPLYSVRGFDLPKKSDNVLLSKAKYVMETLFEFSDNVKLFVQENLEGLDAASRNSFLETALLRSTSGRIQSYKYIAMLVTAYVLIWYYLYLVRSYRYAY